MTATQMQPIHRPWLGQLLRFAPYIAGCIILIILPVTLPSYLQTVITKALILAIFAMSLDIVWGYSGLLSLGHAAYFGIAGYTSAILLLRYGIQSFWVIAPCGILMSMLVAAIFGIIALRVSGIYFLLVTFALGQLVFSVVIKWTSMTGGTDGLVGIPSPDLGLDWLRWSTINFYLFVLLTFAICFFLLYRFVNSPFGYALRGIRDNEAKMRTMGYNSWLYKYVAFIVGGGFAGVAGILYMYLNGVVAPAQVNVLTSGLAALMCILGGVGTLFGPVVGAIVIVFAEFITSILTPERWPLILGIIFVAAVMYLRGGIGNYFFHLWKKALSLVRTY